MRCASKDDAPSSQPANNANTPKAANAAQRDSLVRQSASRNPARATAMSLAVQLLWLIPALPLLAAGVGALTPRGGRALASTAAIVAMAGAFLLSCGALVTALNDPAVHLT